VARSGNIAHNTVREYCQRAKAAGTGWPLPEGTDDARLDALLFQRKQYTTSRSMPDIAYLHRERCKEGATLQLLWHEYKESYPDGYQYTQFCEHYRRGRKKLDLCLRQEHRASEKIFVDFCRSDHPHRGPAHRGDHSSPSIFVAVFGASN
jgi:transposase